MASANLSASQTANLQSASFPQIQIGFKLPSYIPQFDGLRALAVLAVALCHMGLPCLSYGWIGNNLFLCFPV